MSISHGFLVEHGGADVTAQDENGSTPLHQAAQYGRIDLARFLVEHGADVTARGKDGTTPQPPLHWASQQSFGRNVDLTRFLGKHGADVTSRTRTSRPSMSSHRYRDTTRPPFPSDIFIRNLPLKKYGRPRTETPCRSQSIVAGGTEYYDQVAWSRALLPRDEIFLIQPVFRSPQSEYSARRLAADKVPSQPLLQEQVKEKHLCRFGYSFCG